MLLTLCQLTWLVSLFLPLSQLFWDPLLASNFKLVNIFHKIVKCLSLNIYYVLYILLWIKYLVNDSYSSNLFCFYLTFTASQLFWTWSCTKMKTLQSFCVVAAYLIILVTFCTSTWSKYTLCVYIFCSPSYLTMTTWSTWRSFLMNWKVWWIRLRQSYREGWKKHQVATAVCHIADTVLISQNLRAVAF